MKIGDVVWHERLHRNVTINSIGSMFVHVLWFEGRRLCEGYINVDCLTKVDYKVHLPVGVVSQVMQWNSM
jgi:hypothetical protein